MMRQAKLAAFRIERRSVAAAVFVGTHLDYVDSRQLAANHQKAEASAVGFVNWIFSTFEIQTAALESIENGTEILRSQLHGAIHQSLSSGGASIYRVGKTQLLDAYAYPSLRSRNEMRQVVTTIWPILDSNKVSPRKLDAVALGLYVQTERLFDN